MEEPQQNTTPEVTAAPTTSPQPPAPKSKSMAWVLMILGIVIVILIGVIAFFILGSKNQNTSNTVVLTIPTSTPVITQATPSPVANPPITQISQLPTQWQDYKSGQNILGVSINTTKGWTIKFRKEDTSGYTDFIGKTRLTFDFSPPNWNNPGHDFMGWGVIFFDIYDPQPNIDQWINKFAPPHNPKELTVTPIATIGGKPAFSLASTVNQYGATVVLGTNYSYDIVHGNGGSSEFTQTAIGNVLYPMFHID